MRRRIASSRECRQRRAQYTTHVDQAVEGVVGQALPLAALVKLDPANAEEVGRQIGTLMTDRVQALQAEATGLQEELDALLARREQTAADLQAEDGARVAALTARAEQIEQAVTAEKARFDQLLLRTSSSS